MSSQESNTQISHKASGPAKVSLMKGAEPFEYMCDSRTGCLLLHGFTASPQLMRELAVKLREAGLTCRAPLLPGHGTSVDELNRTSWEEMEAASERELLDFQKKCGRVVLVGESSGFLIALRLALKHPDKVAGIVSVGGSLVFTAKRANKLVVGLVRWISPKVPKLRKADLADKRALSDRVAYSEIPMHAYYRLLKYAEDSHHLLPDLKAPLLILQGRKDHIVSVKSVEVLEQRTQARLRKTIWYPNSQHILLADIDKQKVFTDITAFAKEIEREEKV
jgi:carboxylesterase